MQTIAICEDEALWQEQILSILNNIQTNGELKIDVFSSGNELLKDYSYGKYDLLFLDIYMSGMSGVETAKRIREIDSDVSIAFTTTSPDHALEAYRLNVMKYLEKPIKQQDVLECIALMRMQKKNRREITLLISGREHSFPEDQIAYIEQSNHTLLLYLSDGSCKTFSGKLDTIQECFPMPPFYRCHKSFLVNLGQVAMLNKKLMVFEMKSNKNVYIRRGNLKEASKIFDDYIFQELKKK